MKVGITGSDGFIAWHFRCYLSTLDNITKVKLANRATFEDTRQLETFVNELDLIVHLAGVNRADDQQLLNGNIEPAQQLVDALKEAGAAPTIIYSSSTFAEDAKNAYGKGKRDAGRLLTEYGSESGANVVNMVIPHVFGEYGRPFYNSGVATFCHQIANAEKMDVNRDGQLELIHVQDLVEHFLMAYQDGSKGTIRIAGMPISVGSVVDKLNALHDEYVSLNRLPDLSDKFTRHLFNTLRGSIPYDKREVSATKHTDDRGWLVETVKAGSTGQCFVSTTKPNITRGNHFHRRKVERFFVLQGKARIDIRRLFSEDVISYEVDGNQPAYVDMPTLHTHKITNVGEDELITLFWADEFFDPENPDTYFENV